MKAVAGSSLVALVACAALAVQSVPAAAAGGRPCATMALVDLERRGGAPAHDIGFGDRPTELRAVFDSALHPVRVHAGNGVTDERAQLVLGFVDAAWEAQVTIAGFPEPLADGTDGGDARLDVYVVPLPPGLGGVTIANADADPDDGRHASPAFMQIDPTLPDDLLEVYTAHELHHALQFAIDTDESIMWFESTAVFWEVRTRPDVDDWHGALADFQSQPQAPLFATGADLTLIATRPVPRYEYGAVLFALYLDEEHGDGQGSVLGTIWEGCAQPDSVDDNEPDFLDAMSAAGVEPGEVLPDFVGWRALVGPLAVPDDGPLELVPAEGVLAAGQLNAATLDGTVEVTTEEEGPFPLGCVVRSVAPPANVDTMPVDVHVEAGAAGQQIALSTFILRPDDDEVTRTSGAPGTADDATLSVPADAILQLAVCDVTPVDADAPLAARPVRISVRRTDVDFPDAGPPLVDAGVVADAGEPPPPDPTCSCQSTSSSGSAGSSSGDPRRMRAGIGVLGLLLGVFGFGVRGVRQWKRRRLYRR